LSESLLNKFEKHALVIRLLKEGKTYREICHIAHIAPRDINSISKKYEQQKRLENNKRKENNQQSTQPKKPPICTQAFKLFSDGKKLTDVAIDLEIPARKALELWSQFLKLERMEDCYEFYQEYSYDIPRFLSIATFMKRNNISGNDVVNVLREANDVINLNQIISNLKAEINRLKQTKNNYSLNQNMQPVPLGPLPRYYNWNY
jgi:uncharacterized protein YerC